MGVDYKNTVVLQPINNNELYIMNFNNIIFDSKLQDDEELLPFVAVAEDEEPVREDKYGEVLPVMPLKNTVLFPGVIIPITVGRDKSIRALAKSQETDKYIAVLTQLDHRTEDPGFKDLYQTGTVARIVKLLKMPDGGHTVILQGRKRIQISEWTKEEPYLEARIAKKEHTTSSKNLK